LKCKGLKTLLSGNLYFSSPDYFNDPFEFGFVHRIEDLPLERKLSLNFTVETGNNILEIEEKWTSWLKVTRYSTDVEKYGVCCFSETKSSIIMWAHYADSHTGLCAGFDFNERLQNNNLQFGNELLYCDKVRYDKIKREVPYRLQENTKEIYYVPWEIIYNKSKEWDYEEEIRIISQKMGLHEFPKETLKEIYFCNRVSEEKICKIKRIFSKRNLTGKSTFLKKTLCNQRPV